MEHLLLKAAIQAALDEGVFEAVISSATIDREKDIVSPEGMVRALKQWVPTGKKIPLAWHHSTDADKQIGYIDPASARVVNNEVVASGYIDQSIPVGKDAWRLVKLGTLGFSFGYLATKSSPRKGGGRHIEALDVFEITATPIPMNGDTRILGYKADELRREADKVARQAEEATLPEVKQAAAAADDAVRILTSMIGQAREFIDAEDDPEDAAVMADILSALEDLLSEEQDEPGENQPAKAAKLRARKAEPPPVKSAEELRKEADAVQREHEQSQLPAATPVSANHAMLRITLEEMDGLASGELKAVWSASYVNDLADSAFLFVEDGGAKDSDGKTTPRSLRHFPYKDANGAVDLPHLRNALARIPQSNLPQEVKDRLTATAQRILDQQNKSVDDADRQSLRDPLRARADAVALQFHSGGQSLLKPPNAKAAPKPEPELSLKELRQRTREEMLTALSGGTET